MFLYDLFVMYESQSGSQRYACCPLHAEKTASFTVNEETGEWYCHGCERGGAEVEFLEYYFDVSRKTAHYAFEQFSTKRRLPFPTEEEIEEMHRELMKRPSELEILHGMGISDQIIQTYQIGYEATRYIFPIRSRTGRVINVRKYLPPHRRMAGVDTHKVIQIRGLGEKRYFPYDAFDEKEVYIVEGEKDVAVARSHGLNAVTGTGGSSMPTQELDMFRDKTVYLMLDTDPPGERQSKQYLKLLKGVAAEVHYIRLPVKDFADYWAKHQNTDVLQYEITQETNPLIRSVDEAGGQEEKPVEVVSLQKSESVTYLNEWIKLENMSVVGADPKTYSVPTKLALLCTNANCKRPCSVALSKPALEVPVDPRQIVQFVNAADSVQDTYVRKLIGCKHIQAEPVDLINAQKLIFQESASFVEGIEDSTFEVRYGLFLYKSQRLVPTLRYTFETCRVTDPRTQQNQYIIRKAEKQAEYEVTDYEPCVAYFKEKAADCTTVEELLNKHYDLWKPLLGIEGRADLFGALAMTYLSVTEIPWRGGVLKGWLDTLVIGDTRTGKSQMAQRLVKALHCGAYINGENARATGVVGGCQKMGDSWVITWGAIPMNDRGLLIVDEASGLTIDEIKELSAVRSSGAVTINKIVKGEARARTRLVWLTNPRSGRNVDEFYWKGFGAFVEFIPVVEDQARFDLVLTAARDDVEALEGIDLTQPTADIEMWVNMINLAWQTPVESVVVSKEVEQAITATVKSLSEDYGGGPLIVSVAAHEKLIRIATAISVLLGSVKVETAQIVVEPQAVAYTEQYLRMVFDKASLDYKGYIREHQKAQRRKVENTQFVRALCSQHPALRVLLASNLFRGAQVREVLGVDQLEASKMISELLKRGLLRVNGSGAYAPDKMLIDMAKEMAVDS